MVEARPNTPFSSTVSGSEKKSVLMMGHRDTVFPKGEAERRPFRIEGQRAYGPGVADMKAGLVMSAFNSWESSAGAPIRVSKSSSARA